VKRDPGATGRALLALCALALVGAGLFAVVLAATVKLLPNDTETIGMSVDELCRVADCRIVDFMAHDRAAMAGTFIAMGAIYGWLALVPLARGEAWAWWTLTITGAVGFTSFLSYLGYGYLDTYHAIATLMLLAVFVAGLALSRRGLPAIRGPGALVRSGPQRPFDGRLGAGRAGLLAAASGFLLGGVVVLVIGVTSVFVPQDLDFIGLSADDLRAVDDNLVPVIAHDRTEFGGGLAVFGLLCAAVAWRGLRSGERSLWWTLAVAGFALFAGAIVSHPVIGYTALSHVGPAYAGAVGFMGVLAILRRPLVRAALRPEP
jgi:hypothetical protein